MKIRSAVLLVALGLAVLLAYANHFDNAFQFDDSHTIVDNPYIRDLGNLPQFFTDARTSTILPANQIYRPLVTASLAIDYRIAGGLNPTWFHVSTFVWFVVQLALMFGLFLHVMNRTREHAMNAYIALFATAWYGLHPVSAETVNYIYQRGELYSALGVVGGIFVYARFTALRRYGLYLVPALLGMLAKQTALMFAPLLLLYILLFEGEAEGEGEAGIRSRLRQLLLALRQAAPAFVLAAAYFVFQHVMTANTWTGGAASRLHYWLTQPIVTLHYAISFFAPTELSTDSDRAPVTRLLSEEVIIGGAFLVALVLVIRWSARRRELRPVTFGLVWFLIALIPAAATPLAEVENNHRMFLPFVGLVLAVTWGLAQWLEAPGRARLRSFVPLLAVAMLGVYGYGANRRNAVWDTPETLWKDVTEKSPHNGRGFMNYGITLMARGDYQTALASFTYAEHYIPSYYLLTINTAIARGGLGQDAAADATFKQAIAIAPDRYEPRFYFARWLAAKDKNDEATILLIKAIELNPDFLPAAHLLMQLHHKLDRMQGLAAVATATLARFPGDPASKRYLAIAKQWPNGRTPTTPELARAEAAVKTNPTPEALLELSYQYQLAGRHRDSIIIAREAIAMRPGYAEAYNNISSAAAAMKDWDAAIAAAEQALQLKPDYELARNNLAFAQSQRTLQQQQAPPTP